MRRLRIDRRRAGRKQRRQAVADQHVAREGGLLLVALAHRARAHVPVAVRLLLVAAVDDHARLAPVTGHARERVVELVDELHLADAHPVQLVDRLVDHLLRAGGLAVVDVAVEELRHLDPLHDRELALVDHAAGLERIVDQPQPSLAGPAVLGVDVVLERVQVTVLQARAVHLVAAVPLERIEVAERLVLDQQVHEDPEAAAPRALDPLVIRVLVRQRLRVGPAGEGRPAAGVVAARRVAVQDVLEHRAAAAAGRVVGAVDERVLDAVLVPRPAAVRRPAEELERHPVHVAVDEAAHVLATASTPRACRWRSPRSRGTRRSPSWRCPRSGCRRPPSA